MNYINKRKIGATYENVAKEYLVNKGYTILETNHRNKCGEIDIISAINDMIVFCEVKYRSNMEYGDPLEAVDYRKQHKIIKAAMYYCMVNDVFEGKDLRFDVIAIYGTKVVKHIINAFDAN